MMDAKEQLRDAGKELVEGAYGVHALPFQKVQFTTFIAEYAWQGDDLIFHFWAPKGIDKKRWQQEFASVLSDAAEEYFEATYPRLKAAFADELDSWWFKASSYTPLNQAKFAEDFLDTLDQKIEAK